MSSPCKNTNHIGIDTIQMTSFLPHSLLKDCDSKWSFIWRNRGLRFQYVNLGCTIPPLKPPSPSLLLPWSSPMSTAARRPRVLVCSHHHHRSSQTEVGYSYTHHLPLGSKPIAIFPSSSYHQISTPVGEGPQAPSSPYPLLSYPSDVMYSSLPHPRSDFLRITTFRKPK